MFQSYLSQIDEEEEEELFEKHNGADMYCTRSDGSMYSVGVEYLLFDPSFLVEKGYLENSKIIDPLTGEEFTGKFVVDRDCCPYKYIITYVDHCEEIKS